jgi:hypothetical protein
MYVNSNELTGLCTMLVITTRYAKERPKFILDTNINIWNEYILHLMLSLKHCNERGQNNNVQHNTRNCVVFIIILRLLLFEYHSLL